MDLDNEENKVGFQTIKISHDLLVSQSGGTLYSMYKLFACLQINQTRQSRLMAWENLLQII